LAITRRSEYIERHAKPKKKSWKEDLAHQHVSFAFETTLASRSFAPWLRKLRASGYRVHLVFLWLPSVDLALARVADRVRRGGHDVPAETIRRRYKSGLRNLFRLYEPLASTWRVYDSSAQQPQLVATGLETSAIKVYDEIAWSRVTASETS